MANQAAATYNFLVNLHTTSQELYNTIPECFMQQATQNYDSFCVDAGLISNKEFSNPADDPDYVRINIISPKRILEEHFNEKGDVIEEVQGVTIVLQLNMLYDKETLQLVKFGKNPDETRFAYTNGYRSLPIKITPEHVALGLLSQDDYDNLVEYAKTWESIEAESGDRAMYTEANARKRLWLAAGSLEFLLCFNMTTRINPQKGTTTLGIQDISWAHAKVRGYGAGSRPVEATIATHPVKLGSKKVVLPKRGVSTTTEDAPFDTSASASSNNGKGLDLTR